MKRTKTAQQQWSQLVWLSIDNQRLIPTTRGEWDFLVDAGASPV